MDSDLTALARTVETTVDRHIPRTRVSSTGERFDTLVGLLRQPSAIELGAVLGEGGMGVVRAGTQRSLARSVAVKSSRGEASEGEIVRLLREAWVTGYVEHPNIVPVYDIALDESGAPLILMKRIEGTEWSSLLGDAEAVRDRFGVDDVLAWHLRILIEVCHAVSFAHARGIIHRDIKPSNVMIGRFGEVYLLDWGIASSMGDDHGGRIARAADAKEMAGTPVYMAPEMLGGAPLDERTDVYLLGATLYEIVTGEPPHAASSVLAVLTSVARSEPAIPEALDEELASLVRSALSRDPAARPASVDRFRAALAEHLEHRGSRRLARDGLKQLGALEAAINGSSLRDGSPTPAPFAGVGMPSRSGATHVIDAAGAEGRPAVYNLLGACRFALHHALEAWPENVEARRALGAAISMVIDYELAAGEPRRAAELLATLEEPDSALAQRVERALEEADQERARLETLARRNDPRVGRRARVWLTTIFGSLWVAIPVAAHLIGDRVGAGTYPTTLAAIGGAGLASAVGAYFGRAYIFATTFNRITHLTIVVTLAAAAALNLGAWSLGIDPVAAEVLFLLLCAGISTLTVLAVDGRLAPIPVAFFAAYVVALFWPEQRYLAMAGAALVQVIVAYAVFREKDERDRLRPAKRK